MKLGEARSSYFEETVAETHCNDAGQACAGIIRDNGATSAGRDWSRYLSYILQRRSRLGSARKNDFIDSGRIPLYWKRTFVRRCPWEFAHEDEDLSGPNVQRLSVSKVHSKLFSINLRVIQSGEESCLQVTNATELFTSTGDVSHISGHCSFWRLADWIKPRVSNWNKARRHSRKSFLLLSDRRIYIAYVFWLVYCWS